MAGAHKLGAVKRGGYRALAALAATAGLFSFIANGSFAASDTVKVRFGGDAVATRIVIDLDRSVQGKVVSGEGRNLVFDFPKLSGVSGLDGVGRGLVGAWSLDSTATGARMKLTLSKDAVIERRFLLAPSEGSAGYRYVIDLKSADAPAAARPAQVASTSAAKPSVLVKPAASASAMQLVSNTRAPSVPVRQIGGKKIIVIDAGHGGHDPGALGSASKEKDITLAMAKAVKARLEKTGRYRVVMTRDGDTYVPLENRVQIARRSGADLFISLHADAGAKQETRGASVYTLSDQGSERVARRAATGGEGFLNIAMPGGTKAVREILFDLTQRATRNKSGAFADILISNVSETAPLLTRAHRDARYVVLLAPDVPAVLLEMGFMTNLSDEALLTNAAKRADLASGIAGSIDEYFAREVRIAAQ